AGDRTFRPIRRGVEEPRFAAAGGGDLRDPLSHRPRAKDGDYPSSGFVHHALLYFAARTRETSKNVPRIILIDDSPSARTLIGTRLREGGWEGEDGADATAGAELAIGAPPTAVVTDLWMPGISGLQLCRLLRADPATQNVPVILLTASDDRRTRFWA